jgi:hypothetical protein
MPDWADKATDAGANSRPLDDTVAQSGPGIPDDAASPGYDPVADAEADRKEAEAEVEPPGADTLFNGP